MVRVKKQLNADEIYRVYSSDGDFLGLGKAVETQLKVEKLFVNK